jgi:transposase-like protein
MSNLAHASKPKENDNNNDLQRIAGRSAERRQAARRSAGDKGLRKELKVRLMERMLSADLTEHLDYEPHSEPRVPLNGHYRWWTLRSSKTKPSVRVHQTLTVVSDCHSLSPS